MTRPQWTPANGTESAMADALRRGDSRDYFRALAAATLYLPAFTEPGPQQLVTVRSGDDVYLLVFTSPEAMARRLHGVGAFRTTGYHELLRKWPDPSWLLAVDPDLPIQGFMPITMIGEGAAGRPLPPAPAPAPSPSPSREPARVPASSNALETDLPAALRSGDVDEVVRLLVLGDVYVPVNGPVPRPPLPGPGFPWRPAGEKTIDVYTSERSAPPPSVRVPFLDVAIGWPGPDWRLVVDPGSPLELTFPGEHVLGFVGWAQDFAAAADLDETP